MAVNPVPLAVDGSQVDAYILRQLANFATRDAQGIQLPGHMKVTALASPSMNVTVAPGGAVIRNAQAPGQSYVASNASATVIPVPAANTARSDLVMAYIRDPEFSPWQPYTDPTQILFGPYFDIVVQAGVPAGTTSASQVVSYSAMALARIDIPAGATSITNAMITDLRELASPRIGFGYDVQPGPTLNYVTTSEITWHDWPANSLATRVPPWATHAQVGIDLNIKVDAAADVNLRVNLGGLTGPTYYFDYNGAPGTSVGYVEVLPFRVYGEFDVRGLQGQLVTAKPQARRDYVAGAVNPGSNNGNVWAAPELQVAFDIRYSERVV